MAASIEEHSVHPLALAVAEAACGRGYLHFHHSEVESIVAHAVAATIQGERVVVGSRHFMVEKDGIDDSAHREVTGALGWEGKSSRLHWPWRKPDRNPRPGKSAPHQQPRHGAAVAGGRREGGADAQW